MNATDALKLVLSGEFSTADVLKTIKKMEVDMPEPDRMTTDQATEVANIFNQLPIQLTTHWKNLKYHVAAV